MSVLNPRGEPVTVIVRAERDPILDAWWQDGPAWQPITRIEIVGLYCFLVFWAADWSYALYLLLKGGNP